MRHSYRPAIPPPPQPSRPQVFDHVGLVAGMCDELGITAVIEQAPKQAPAMRMVTAGQAVTAMERNGLGFLNQPLSLAPPFFQPKPLARLLAPGMQASHLPEAPLGRALETLYDCGVPALSSLRAATAAQRLGLASPCTPRASPGFPVDGRSQSEEAPDDQGGHRPPGESREHRPDLNQVRWAWVVEHPAGLPVRMKALSGHRNDPPAFGPVGSDHLAQLHTPDTPPSRVADRALARGPSAHAGRDPPHVEHPCPRALARGPGGAGPGAA